MPDVYYDSTLTGQELDDALRNIPANVTRAEKAATNAEASAKTSESWAHGGTGTREGEETNNAEYWAGQARTSAESAADSAQVITDNKKAIQAVQENLAAVKSAADNALRAEAAADSASGDADRAEAAADRAQSIAQGALGYYPKAENLRAAHESGENGQWAIIGETDTIWVWDSDSGAWVNSGSKIDPSQYYTKDETDADLEKMQTAMNTEMTQALEASEQRVEQALQKTEQTVNTTMTGATRTLTDAVETAKAEALGKVLYLYSAIFAVNGWRGNDSTGYTQNVSITPQDGGPVVTAATQLGIPMARPTGVQNTDEALQEALAIINAGTSTPGSGTVSVKVWEKPETAITVFWYGR